MQTLSVVPQRSPYKLPVPRAVRPHLSIAGRSSSVSCSACNLRRFCLSPDIEAMSAAKIDQVVETRMRLRKGDVLFRAGERFTSLYSIRTGSCKTVMLTDDGNEQIVGFHLPGEIIGVEGIGPSTHGCQAVALEDSEVCVLPFDRVESLAHEDAAFQHEIYRMLSSEIGRGRNAALRLGTMRAEQRLSSFLLDLSQRYQARGYSATEFVLRMTREEIGSQLGLKLETVSRLLSRFGQEGLIKVRGRVISLLDRIALQQLIAAS